MNRLVEIKQHLLDNNIDAFLVTNLDNVRYLSGFSGSAGYLVISGRVNYFVSDFRYKTQAPKEIVNDFTIKIYKQGSFEFVNELFKKFRFKSIGFESSTMIFDQYTSFQNMFKNVKLIPVTGLVESLTAVKTETEIASIKKAVKITDKVFSKILKMIKPGVSEKDIDAEISYLHKKYGAEKNSFDPIVASGMNSALPHAKPTNRKFKKGDLLTIDLGCSYNGFCSDMTRTVGIGKISNEAKKIYSVVKEAQQIALDAVREGAHTKKVDSDARNFIKKKGFGNNFGHGLGHGLGVAVHEAPRLNQDSDAVLKSNNVVTIEPGIYIEGLGGVRIEDDVVVTKDGCEILNRSTKDLILL